MNYLDNIFFEEFKSLDNLCKDIYGRSADNKLSISLYLEDMQNNQHKGALLVDGWKSDYDRLKRLRHLRNSIAHDTNAYSASPDDIDFVRSFVNKILTQNDPLSMLNKTTRVQYTKEAKPKYIPRHLIESGDKETQKSLFNKNESDNESTLYNSILTILVCIVVVIAAIFILF